MKLTWQRLSKTTWTTVVREKYYGNTRIYCQKKETGWQAVLKDYYKDSSKLLVSNVQRSMDCRKAAEVAYQLLGE